MSISAVREAYKVFEKEKGHHTWLEECELELISELARYILNSAHPICEDKWTSEYITLDEFEHNYMFVAQKTLRSYCRKEDFVSNCAVLHQAKWYVHPQKTIDYLTRVSPALKKRYERIFSGQNVSQ